MFLVMDGGAPWCWIETAPCIQRAEIDLDSLSLLLKCCFGFAFYERFTNRRDEIWKNLSCDRERCFVMVVGISKYNNKVHKKDFCWIQWQFLVGFQWQCTRPTHSPSHIIGSTSPFCVSLIVRYTLLDINKMTTGNVRHWWRDGKKIVADESNNKPFFCSDADEVWGDLARQWW